MPFPFDQLDVDQAAARSRRSYCRTVELDGEEGRNKHGCKGKSFKNIRKARAQFLRYAGVGQTSPCLSCLTVGAMLDEMGRKEWSVSNPVAWDDGITIGLSLLLPIVMSMANHDDRFRP
ncbi:MAG: hypothetical protein ACR2RE_25540, partial [Geminicoccaceae bacterium]